MSTIFTILLVAVALILIAVILVQQPKTSGGLFAGTGQSVLGTSGKTFWTKTTIGLAAVFMVLCIILTIIPKYEKPDSVADIIEKQQQQAAQMPASATPVQAGAVSTPQSAPAPAQPAAQQAPSAK